MRKIKNARIESVSLGFEDHGILTAFLHLDYGGEGQGFGGYSLGGEYASKFISRTLKTIGVDLWENLPGRVIRVDADFGRVHAIGHALRDDWFNPGEEWAAPSDEVAAP